MTRRTIAVLAGLLLAGCAGAGPYHAPDVPLAAAWSAANAVPRDSRREWWHDFADPALDRLIERGLADNTRIAVSLARLDQARAAAGAAHAALLPSAQTADSVARTRQSVDSGLGRLVPYVPGLSRAQNQGDLGVSASWDIDFAGGLAGQDSAARADALAANAALAATRLGIAAEIADAYANWRNARADQELLLQQRALVAQAARIVAARVTHGDGAQADGDQARAALSAIDALLPDAQGAVASARNRLAILTGRPAGTVLPELAGIGASAMPAAAEPAAGTPADLLRQRPDLVVAEAQLRARHARVGAALAEYWPKFSLSGLFGFSSNDLSLLGSNSANVITGAVGLRWRLFDFGRIDAEVAGARGAEREALAAYRGAVLAAGGEVEDAFIALAEARRALAARQIADTLASDQLNRARASQRAGETSQADWVAAQSRRIDAARALIAAQTRLSSAVIACHRALGS